MSRHAADIFQAIPTRRAILDQLRYGEQPVKQLAEPFDMSLPAISQHLRVLCETWVQQRTGRPDHRLIRTAQTDFSDWVAHYEQFWRN